MNTRNQNKQKTARDERRLERDNKTVMVMAKLFCHDHHCGLQGENGLCLECSEVVNYALQRTKTVLTFIREFVRRVTSNAINLRCGNKFEQLWPIVARG